MKRYTINEACLALQTNRVTLERHMKRLKIRYQQGDLDRREHYIVEADIERLRNMSATLAQRRTVVAQQDRRPKAEIIAENIALKAELAALKAKPFRASYAGDAVAQSPPIDSSVPASVASSESPRRPSQGHSRWADYERITDYPRWTPESGYAPLSRLLSAHGIKATTAQKQREGNIFAAKMFLIEKAPGYVIDRENALIALRLWRDRGLLNMATIGRCGVVNCPCADLAGDT